MGWRVKYESHHPSKSEETRRRRLRFRNGISPKPPDFVKIWAYRNTRNSLFSETFAKNRGLTPGPAKSKNLLLKPPPALAQDPGPYRSTFGHIVRLKQAGCHGRGPRKKRTPRFRGVRFVQLYSQASGDYIAFAFAFTSSISPTYKKRLFRQIVRLAEQIASKLLSVSAKLARLAFHARELLGHEERLTEETLDLACSRADDPACPLRSIHRHREWR